MMRGGRSRRQPFNRVNQLVAVQPKGASRSDIPADEGEYDRRERSYRAERVHIAERQPLRVLTRHCVGGG